MSSNPLIIDVDTGVDDAVALAFAIAKGANLVGVTTVAGNVSIDVATRNTLDVLAYLGREDIPVHRGSSRPLVADYDDARDVHGANGLGGMELAPSSTPQAVLAGPAFIIQCADRFAGELDLVAVGPLTNLAIALNVRPQIVLQMRSVVVMGGAYFVPGNKMPDAEFNVYVDPDAAHQVFNANWNDITLVGLDVTHQAVLSRELWASIPGDAAGAAGLVRGVTRRTFSERGKSGFYLHDPLAVAVALEPDLVRGTHFAVNVELTGEARGKTSPNPRNSGPMIATEVDAEGFVRDLGQVLGLPVIDVGAGFDNAE
jgi:inosine-uridine nucleoside N-ribohydrolase